MLCTHGGYRYAWVPSLATEAQNQDNLLFALYFPNFTCFRNVRSIVFPGKVPIETKPGKSEISELISKLLGLMKLNKDVTLPSYQFSILVTTFFFLSTQILELKVIK